MGGGRSLSALLREGARVGARPGKGGSKSRRSPGGGGEGVNKKIHGGGFFLMGAFFSIWAVLSLHVRAIFFVWVGSFFGCTNMPPSPTVFLREDYHMIFY